MGAIIAGIFALLIGAVGLWTGFQQLKNRTILNRWQKTKGKIVERGIFQPDTPSLNPSAFQYAPLVKYVYEVNGQLFVNDCIHPKRIQLPEHNTKEWAQERAASFADEVTVHYNPLDPGDSFLIQTSKGTLYLVIGASLTAIFLGIIFFLTK